MSAAVAQAAPAPSPPASYFKKEELKTVFQNHIEKIFVETDFNHLMDKQSDKHKEIETVINEFKTACIKRNSRQIDIFYKLFESNTNLGDKLNRIESNIDKLLDLSIGLTKCSVLLKNKKRDILSYYNNIVIDLENGISSLPTPPGIVGEFSGNQMILILYILCSIYKKKDDNGLKIDKLEFDNLSRAVLIIFINKIIVAKLKEELAVRQIEKAAEKEVAAEEAKKIPTVPSDPPSSQSGGKRRRSRNKRRAKTRKNLRKRSRKSKKNN